MTIKGFILNIGHGLNENKFMNTTNVYSPKQKCKHLIKMIEIIQSAKKLLGHNWNFNFLDNVGNYNKLDE